MAEILDVPQFLIKAQLFPLLDVRSPMEFEKAHIPDALSFPLFSDSERAVIGTTYTQIGQQEAILQGLDIVGCRLGMFVREALKIVPGKIVCLHCWRGGMRSSSMAWLLETAGFKVYILKSGYKNFRKYIVSQFTKPYRLISLGGYTGSGKTEILSSLKDRGEQVIDLENLASHLGSAFGSLGTLKQPSQEMFENMLGLELEVLDGKRPLWLEDESINLGSLQIPKELWKKLQMAPLMRLNIPREERLRFILERYGKLNPLFLAESVIKLKKRLGNEIMNACLIAIENNDLFTAAEFILEYYDKCYEKSILRRQLSRVEELTFSSIQQEYIAMQLITQSSK